MSNDPEVFGGFLLVRRLAESAMAWVYLAVRLGDTSGKALVLKRPPLGERASGRAAQAILREAEVLQAVRGAGIPALEAAGEIAGLPYVAVERLRGASLAKILALGEPVPAVSARAIGRDIARALAVVHAAGWVHRDVTPSNVFVDDAGEAHLLDYGLCARAGEDREAVVAGTRGYAAPEAATSNAARPAQDVYGLAVCLAETALGRRLFDEASLVEAAGRGDAPREVVALEATLPGICAAMKRDPAARPSAEAFGERLVHDAPGAPGASGAPGAPGAGDASALPSFTEARDALTVLAERARALLPDDAPFAPTPPRALTPTASMPLVTLRDIPLDPVHHIPSLDLSHPVSTPLIAQVTSATIPVSGIVTRSVPPPRPSPVSVRLAAVLAIAALVMGIFAGRFSMRQRGGSFSITGNMPKRTDLLLDNKKLTFAEGVPMPVPVGSHTLTIASPKNGKREIAFNVRPGEHVVVIAAPRGTSGTPDGAPAGDDGP